MKTILPLLLCPLLTFATEVKLERVPENGLQPQIAVTGDGSVHLVYLTGEAGAANVRYTVRKAGDAAWREPVTVNSIPRSAVAAGTIRGAQIAAGRDGRVHVVWNGAAQNGQHATAPLYYTRLEDGKFAPQRTLNSGTIHLDGGASVAAGDKGGVFVVWHASPPDGKSEADRRIYVSRSSDDGATFSAAAPAKGSAPGVCACCSLKAFIAPGGALLTLYRNASAPSQRDMALLTSHDGGKSFETRTLDPWSIAACPMSSAALLSSGAGTVAAWETDGIVRTGTLAQKMNPLHLTKEKGRHPSLAVNRRGETLVTWSAGTGWKRGGELGWMLLDDKGGLTKNHGSAPGVPVWGHTAAFATASGDFVILH